MAGDTVLSFRGTKATLCSFKIDSLTHVYSSCEIFSCTVRIVELGLEVEPGDNATGYISNIEGVLNRFSDAIGIVMRGAIRDGEEGIEQSEILQELLERIDRIKNGKESAELLLLDPNGHSQILHKSAKSSDLSEQEVSALATGPQIPVFDSSEFEK